MAQNIIVKNKGNPLVINFTFNVPTDPSFGLNGFDYIEVIFGSETYNSTTDPSVVIINSNTQLQLHLGGTSEAYSSYLVINGYNATYPLGYQLTSKCLSNLEIPRMC